MPPTLPLDPQSHERLGAPEKVDLAVRESLDLTGGSRWPDGDDLGRLLREVPIPQRGVFEVIAQVAAALDAALEQVITHLAPARGV